MSFPEDFVNYETELLILKLKKHNCDLFDGFKNTTPEILCSRTMNLYSQATNISSRAVNISLWAVNIKSVE